MCVVSGGACMCVHVRACVCVWRCVHVCGVPRLYVYPSVLTQHPSSSSSSSLLLNPPQETCGDIEPCVKA
jgi:hypothetical protein